MCLAVATLSMVHAAAVQWPYALGPLGSEFVYAPADTLNDADGDGIGDLQDFCAGSPAGMAVNAKGCALGQVPK